MGPQRVLPQTCLHHWLPWTRTPRVEQRGVCQDKGRATPPPQRLELLPRGRLRGPAAAADSSSCCHGEICIEEEGSPHNLSSFARKTFFSSVRGSNSNSTSVPSNSSSLVREVRTLRCLVPTSALHPGGSSFSFAEEEMAGGSTPTTELRF